MKVVPSLLTISHESLNLFNMALRLSKNFISNEFNLEKLVLTDTELLNFALLVGNILQPVRNFLKSPLTVTSGFRSYSYNLAVGGSSKSQHLTGLAVDFTTPSNTLLNDAYYYIMTYCPYDQLIFYKNKHFIHVSLNRNFSLNRKQNWIEY